MKRMVVAPGRLGSYALVSPRNSPLGCNKPHQPKSPLHSP
jgi:hypothetical protein